MFLPLAGADLVLWIPPEDMHDTHFHVSEYPLLAGEPEGHHLIRAAGNRLQQVVAGWSHQVGCFNEVLYGPSSLKCWKLQLGVSVRQSSPWDCVTTFVARLTAACCRRLAFRSAWRSLCRATAYGLSVSASASS